MNTRQKVYRFQKTLLIENEPWNKFKKIVESKGHSISYVLRGLINKYIEDNK